MINPDYPIEALDGLLDRACLSERYYPLIQYKDLLLTGLPRWGCRTKRDAEALPDDALLQTGLPDAAAVRLFRRFLTLYDVRPQKLREIAEVSSDPDEEAAFRELYYLPGVRQVRASLYYRAGYKTVRNFAETTVEEVLARTALTISENGLSCTVPLPKEVRTQIAVAKAFTGSVVQLDP